MSAIKDIVDLAIELETRAKDRKDIDTLRAIVSLTQSVQAHDAEVVERDIRVMQENAQLVAEKAELKRQLAETQAEEFCIHKGIEFRRGKRTRNKWLGFCPKCHMPAQDAAVPKPLSRDWNKVVTCSARCGWQVFMGQKLDEIAAEL